MARPRKPEDRQRWPIALRPMPRPLRTGGHLAGRIHLRILLPGRQTNDRHLRVRPSGRAARPHRGPARMPALQRRQAQRRLRRLRRRSRTLQRRTMPAVRAAARPPTIAHQPRHRRDRAPAAGHRRRTHRDARPNSGLTWIRQPHVAHVLRELARHPTLTHDVLDQLPAGRTTDYMRSLLVEHDVLPSRDERLARFQSWAVTAQQRITTEEHRKVVARFIRWSLEKRLRSMSPVTDSAFLRAKQTVTVTIEFCNWLAAEHDVTVEQVTQAHIDLWQSAGPHHP